MKLIHIENKLVYSIYMLLFCISAVAWIASIIFSWHAWLICLLCCLTINFAWCALLLRIEIAVEDSIEKKFNGKEK